MNSLSLNNQMCKKLVEVEEQNNELQQEIQEYKDNEKAAEEMHGNFKI